MAGARRASKFYTPFTVMGASSHGRDVDPVSRVRIRMGGIAIALFVALFAFGGKYFGWEDPDSKVRLAMAACFVLGALGGYRARS